MTPIPFLATAGVALCSVLAAALPEGDSGETAKLISGGSAGLQALALWTLWSLRRDVDDLRRRVDSIGCLPPKAMLPAKRHGKSPCA